MTQQFYVSKGRTIRGPVTGRKKSTINGEVRFTGSTGKVYTSHDSNGQPIALPAGFVEWLKATKDTNGQTKLQNMIESGFIVFEPGAESPVQFAKAFKTELIADPQGGKVTEEAK
jgi:hypothetical protein